MAIYINNDGISCIFNNPVIFQQQYVMFLPIKVFSNIKID